LNTVFADTFYWIALTNPLDAAHGRANDVMSDIVTTEEVLTEYLNYFSDGPAHLRRKPVPRAARQRLQPDGLYRSFSRFD
jgi:hypothetical protein